MDEEVKTEDIAYVTEDGEEIPLSFVLGILMNNMKGNGIDLTLEYFKSTILEEIEIKENRVKVITKSFKEFPKNKLVIQKKDITDEEEKKILGKCGELKDGSKMDNMNVHEDEDKIVIMK